MQAKAAFATVLRRLRVASGKSQEEFAFDAGIDRSFMSRLERGMGQPTLGTLLLLAHAFEMPAYEIVRQVEVEIKKSTKPLSQDRVKRPKKKKKQ